MKVSGQHHVPATLLASFEQVAGGGGFRAGPNVLGSPDRAASSLVATPSAL